MKWKWKNSINKKATYNVVKQNGETNKALKKILLKTKKTRNKIKYIEILNQTKFLLSDNNWLGSLKQ